MGFRVSGLGVWGFDLGFEGLGFSVWDLRFRVEVALAAPQEVRLPGSLRVLITLASTRMVRIQGFGTCISALVLTIAAFS